MAMTKAEKAEMDALREARDMARALRWPEYPEPEPMSAEEIKANMTFKMKPRYNNDQYACQGWVAQLEGHFRPVPTVRKHFSNGVNNTSDPNGQNWSQNGGIMYRTPEDALQKLRIEMTKDYAARLAAIDALILSGDKQ